MVEISSGAVLASQADVLRRRSDVFLRHVQKRTPKNVCVGGWCRVK